MNFNQFFSELKRRNVYKVAIAYAITSWLLAQMAGLAADSFGAPAWVIKMIIVALVIGFPIALILAWAFEMSPQGMIRTTSVSATENPYSSRKKKPFTSNVFIGVLALIIIGQFAYNKYSSDEEVIADDLDNSIAVLYFDNMSSEKEDNEWFCAGVTEDILTHLSKIKDLKVISRTSVAIYKDSYMSIPEIAKELGVSYIVVGSVRKQGNRVLISAQLISANDKHLWAENYNENLDDVFQIQQEVSKKIVQQLKIVISPEEETALNSSSTTNLEAYQLFIKGRSIADNRNKKDLEHSIVLYKKAIELDSNYADAYAEIANSTQLLTTYGGLSETIAFKKCREYIEKALAINSNTVRAYTVLAMISKVEGKSKEAILNFEKAIEINPNDATAHHHFAHFYYVPNLDNEKATIEIDKAYALDPFSNIINVLKMTILMQGGKIEEAEAHFDKVSYLLSPTLGVWVKAIINSYVKRDATEYIKTYKTALKQDTNNSIFHSDLGTYYGSILNDYKSSLKHTKRAYELDSTSTSFAQSYLYVLFRNNDFKEAKKLLETSKFYELFDESSLIMKWQDYYYYQGDFKNAQIYLEKLKAIDKDNYYYQKAWIEATLGNSENTFEAYNNYSKPSDRIKARLFALLKERDSMYYYINKYTETDKSTPLITRAIDINIHQEFDPYRQEPRFQAFLKNNYLPVSAEN